MAKNQMNLFFRIIYTSMFLFLSRTIMVLQLQLYHIKHTLCTAKFVQLGLTFPKKYNDNGVFFGPRGDDNSCKFLPPGLHKPACYTPPIPPTPQYKFHPLIPYFSTLSPFSKLFWGEKCHAVKFKLFF